NMPPYAECDEQRNPPCSEYPVEQGEAFDEDPELPDQCGIHAVDYEHGTGECRDGQCPHVDPVRRCERHRLHFQEHQPVEYECDDVQVKHAAEQKMAE